jgi:AraC-like DNA-binding protein
MAGQNAPKPPVQFFGTSSSLSKFHLERIFEKEVGIPLKKFVILKRLYEAACILRSNEKTKATQVCFDVGFGDFSNFVRQFTKYFGCSPIRFKNCNYDPRKCRLRKHSYIYFLKSEDKKIKKAMNADLSTICYLNRAK